MLETTARSVHCCTNCSRQYCTYSRLNPRLDRKQVEDQAGSSYQTTDHFATYRKIEQKCHEWRIKLWTATIDFTKAFDSITHKINLEIPQILRYRTRLHQPLRDQKASVQIDEESNICVKPAIQDGSTYSTPNPDSKKVGSDQDGLMSYATCHTLLSGCPVVFLVLPGYSCHPSMREAEDSSDLKSEN